jgi:hypothetical protein
VPSGENAGLWLLAEERSVLCSPVGLSIIAKHGHYSRISAQGERDSLQFRLYGGETGIRTFGTVLPR